MSLKVLPRLFQYLGKLYWAFGLSVVGVMLGIIGFMFIEHLSLVDAIYMSVITVSTVGFGEIKPLSDAGKIFTSVYIILNLGLFAYIISTVTTYIFEGEIKRVFKRYMTDIEIEKLSDHYIVCGYGRNGKKVCEELHNAGVTFVVVEFSEEEAAHIPQNFKIVLGDATQDETLLKAGIEKASGLISTLPKDTDNVFIVLTARELNRNTNIISRASEDHSEKKLLRAGANSVVMPDAIGGIHMAQIVTKPYVIELLDILGGVSDHNKTQLEEVTYQMLKENFHNKSLLDLNIRKLTETTVIAVKEHNTSFNFSPNPHRTLDKDDILIVLGSKEAITYFKQYFFKKEYH